MARACVGIITTNQVKNIVNFLFASGAGGYSLAQIFLIHFVYVFHINGRYNFIGTKYLLKKKG